MFERDLGDGWKVTLMGGELALRHDNRTGGDVLVALMDDGVFETSHYVARVPLRVLSAFVAVAAEWERSQEVQDGV